MGVQLPSEPITRKEQYLAKAAGQAVEIPAEPITREEAYLEAIANAGGGGGGTNNYNQLENKPQIAGTTLQGNKSLSDLGIASATALGDVSNAVTAITNGQTINNFSAVETALSNKQDTLTFDDTPTANSNNPVKSGGVYSALAGKQGTLTAGDYINLNNGNISVNRNLVGNNYDYEIKSTGDYKLTIIKSQGGTVISTNTYDYSYGTSTNIDNNFTIAGGYSGGNTWVYTALKDSTTHSTGYTWTKSVEATFDETEAFPSEDLSGYKLVIKSELDAAISSAYHHAGTKTCAELVAGLLVAWNEGNVYNMTDSGTTTSDFIEGAGQPIKAGDNVGIAKISDGVYKFDLLSGFVDTTNFVQKSVTAGLLNNDGTVDTTIQGDVSTLKSGLTTLDNEVNGDATVYPYASSITIPDAIPANVADCTVRIEPVQDLHGYDHPWVGGAYKNKAYVNINSGETALTEIKDNDNNVIGVNADVGAAGVVVTVKMATVSIENGKTYTLSGSPNDKGNSTYRLDVRTQAQGQLYNNWNEIDNPTITATEDVTLDIYLRIAANYAVNNLVFRPQVEEGSTPTTFASYTNICPITGHTEASVQRDGKNLFDMTDVTQGYLLPDSGEINPASENWRTSGYIKVAQNTEYVESGFDNIGASNHTACFYDKNKNFISGSSLNSSTFTFTTPSNTAYVKIDGKTADVTTIQLELGSTATPYVPYAGKTYTIALGDTIYGGTVDFDSGVMTVTHKYVDMGTLGWFKDSTNVFKATLSDGKYGVNLICSQYYATTNVNVDGTIFFNNAYYGDNKMAVCDSRYANDTAETFSTAMNGVQLVYELATPTTIQLTPQQIQLLKGQNTLTASTGQISVTVNGVSGSIGALQTQANDTNATLAELAADIAEKLPTAPTTDGAYVLTVTVADGTPTYSWESAE